MIWTKRFKQDSEYQSYIDGEQGKVYKPNVSVCENEYHVHYNPGPIDRPDEIDYGVIEIDDIEPFNYEGGSETTSLTTRATNTWAITEKSGWLDISPMKGTGATTLTVECDEYESTEEDRKGFFTVRYTMPNTRYSTTKYGITQKHKLDPKTYPLTFVALEDGTFKFSGSTAANTLSYSLDNGTTWVALAHDTDTPTVQSGATIMWKGTPTIVSSKGIGKFISSGRFNVNGNSMSIIYGDNFENQTYFPDHYAFYLLFYNTKVVNCENLVLPAEVVPQYGYARMFYLCRNLITPPILPSTDLRKYSYSMMFYGCTGLTSAPELPATNLYVASYCYENMFGYCTSLTTIPELPATTLAEYCYENMFRNCTSLTEILSLNIGTSATTLSSGCCRGMFAECTNLTSVPSNMLPARTLGRYCYSYMFNSCTSLTTAPELPAITLKDYCYSSMFSGCTSLTTAPELLATTLAKECYNGMFYGCSSLATAPELPATTLADYCYTSMFDGCTSLTTAPELPATTLAQSCYQQMFKGCTSLNYIKCLATDISATNCTNGWVSGVSYTGTFVKNPDMNDWTRGINGIPVNWNVEDIPIDYSSVPLTFEIISDGNIVWKANSSACTRTIEYSKDNGQTWTSVTSDTGGTIISVLSGDNVQFRGDNNTYSSSGLSTYNTFSGTTCGFKLKGNIMSLINSTGFTTATTLSNDYTFMGLFRFITGLTDANNLVLPATDLSGAQSCYHTMFRNCTNLITAPALPATTLGSWCYYSMFENCTSLTTLPTLPATSLTEDCYYCMFRGCTSLTSVPSSYLPATVLANYCYASMFSGCVNITTPPILPATTLENNCYADMFYNCTSLATAPALPATALTDSCYSEMFTKCTSLVTPPALPATTIAKSCYYCLFSGCTNLESVPSLPATTLYPSCYRGMFHGCTKITTAPDLPATSAVSLCYESMFSGCTSLNYVKAMYTNYSASNTMYWLSGVASTGTYVKNILATSTISGPNGIPTGWTVQDATQ